MSSTLRNFTNLEEVSATLDKLKENALKNVRSINDVGNYDYKNKNNKHASDSNTYNTYIVNQKKTFSKEDDFLEDYNHQNFDTYNIYENDASNKSKNPNNDFEYDFVNTDNCLYNKHQQLHEGSHAYTKQNEGSCSNHIENLYEENNEFQSILQMDVHQESHVQHDVSELNTKIKNKLNNINEIYIHEDFRASHEQLFEFMHSKQLDYDKDHYLSSGQPIYSTTHKLFEHTNCNGEATLDSFDGVSNQDKAHDLKYEPSLYHCNPTKNIGSTGHYSNDSSHKESCNSEIDGKPIMEDDINSMQIPFSHLHNDINNYDLDNENENEIKRHKIKGSSLDYDIFSRDEVSNISENNNDGKNHELSSNLNVQEVNESLNENHIQDLKVENCEQRNKKILDDGKCKELHYRASSNSKVDEYNQSSHSDCERPNFNNDDMCAQTFNKTDNRFVRRRFEDRRRMNDRKIPFHIREFEPRGFRRGFNHLRNPHQKMFLRRPNFNERRYNMPRLRYRNEFHNFRNSRLKDPFSNRTRPSYRKNPKDDYKNTSQQLSPSLHKEKPHSNHSRKRRERSLSPSSNEDDTPSHRDNHLIDTRRSLSPNISECRHHRFKPGSSGLGGYSPRRRRPDLVKKTPSPQPRSPERKKTRAWDMAPPGIDTKMVAAIAAAHTAQQVASNK